MKVEFFSAECKLCNTTLDMLYGALPNVPITVHRQSECVDGSCCQLAESYGVRAVPALVVDGKVLMVGRPNSAEMQSIGSTLAA